MAERLANNFETVLGAAVSVGAPTVQLASGQGAILEAKLGEPISATSPVRLTLAEKSGGVEIRHEIIQAEGRSGDTLTGITKGLESTTDQAWAAGDVVSQRWTKELGEQALAGAAGGVFTTPYESGNLSITSSGQHLLTHGLGGEPMLIQYFLRCLNGNNGYSTGNLVPYTNIHDDGSDLGFSCEMTSSQIIINFVPTFRVLAIHLKPPTSGIIAINSGTTDWALVVRAYR